MRIASVAVFLFSVALSTSALGQTDGLESRLADCPTLNACIRIVDANLSADGQDFASSQISAFFQRFGNAGKQEMIRRATGRDPGWRHFADGVLRYWDGWTARDIPTLRRIVRSNPSGMVT